MKIGLYSEFLPNNVLGGREGIAAALFEAFADAHDIEFVHHDPQLTADAFVHHFGATGHHMKLRYLPWDTMPRETSPWRRHREEEAWHAEVSRPYDLFVNISHYFPPYSHAAKGFLMVLFPFHDPRALLDFDSPRFKGAIARRLRRLFHAWQWRRRLRTYQTKAAISEFSQHWTRQRWGVETKVLYPPADAVARPGNKESLILSVGRFSVGGVLKRQDAMLNAFVEASSRFSDWRYVTTGGAGASAQEQAFVQDLRVRATSVRAEVRPNATREELAKLYGTASIFWHAAGHGQNQEENPGLAEHYGIATVEAMFAGCVPVVIRKGAQPEIVEHGVSGFLWDNVEQLQEFTHRLTSDAELRSTMSAAAAQRAERFGRQRFIEEFRQLAPVSLAVSDSARG